VGGEQLADGDGTGRGQDLGDIFGAEPCRLHSVSFADAEQYDRMTGIKR